jgi:hypothetical protein
VKRWYGERGPAPVRGIRGVRAGSGDASGLAVEQQRSRGDQQPAAKKSWFHGVFSHAS